MYFYEKLDPYVSATLAMKFSYASSAVKKENMSFQSLCDMPVKRSSDWHVFLFYNGGVLPVKVFRFCAQ